MDKEKASKALEKLLEYPEMGINMRRMTSPEVRHSGFFGSSYSPAVYEHKIVSDLEEAVEMAANGWDFVENVNVVFANVALFTWRALKILLEEKS